MAIVRGVKFHPELMPIEQLNGAMKRPVRKQLTGSVVGLAEQCIDTLVSLDPELPMRFSRKSFVTLEAYATGDWTRLDNVLKERKQRRRGHDGSQVPSQAASQQSRTADGDDNSGAVRSTVETPPAAGTAAAMRIGVPLDVDDTDEVDAELGLQDADEENE